MPITHTFVNPFPDEPAFAGTKPSDWNADHEISGEDTQLQYNNTGSLTGARILYANGGGATSLSTQQDGDNGENFILAAADGITDGSGGGFTFFAGSSPGSGNGGTISFQAGESDSGTGGNVDFQPGNGAVKGKVRIRKPGSAQYLSLIVANITGHRDVTFPNASLTFAGQDISNDFTADQTFSAAVLLPNIKSGADQAAAGAAANEVWKTAGHATLPDNVLMIGV